MSVAYPPSLGINRAQLGYPNMSPVVSYDDFEDVGSYEFSLTAKAAKWIVGGTNAAVTAATNIDSSALDGGWLFWKTTATSGDELFAQDNTCAHAFATSTSDPRAIEFQTRITVDTITTANVMVGMFATGAVTGTTDPFDTQPVGFGFNVASGVLQYMYKTSATTVALTGFTPAVAITAAQTLTLGCVWDGLDKLQFKMNGAVIATFALPAFTATVLGRSFGLDTASAASKTMKLDYIWAKTEAPKAGR